MRLLAVLIVLAGALGLTACPSGGSGGGCTYTICAFCVSSSDCCGASTLCLGNLCEDYSGEC